MLLLRNIFFYNFDLIDLGDMNNIENIFFLIFVNKKYIFIYKCRFRKIFQGGFEGYLSFLGGFEVDFQYM